ncbi:MAG: hypothetical protein ACOX9B_09985 [Candidatus Xenobium sp.]|nr:hypothetical protein [Burkholderiales bacterium]
MSRFALNRLLAPLAKSLPRYLTWEGQLEAAFRELDRLLDLFWALAEVSPAVLGLDKAGGVESGKALRLRFVNTEHKVNRRRLYLGPALQQTLYVASLLAASKLGAPYVALDAPPSGQGPRPRPACALCSPGRAP